ncbi:MAG TPA: MarR family winged helix-turn-helix transcriptional regulator [Caulobacterales bacterium]|nr:MarR family winged helix-turn-helix transcriptional regulator [Caulobacterales bacterium]
MADGPDPLFPLSSSAAHMLLRALQLADDRFALLAKTSGLTLRQFVVLAAVQAQPGLSQADLVRATSIDRSTLADMMHRMERRGLIIRSQADDDGRANAVRIAPAGTTALQASLTHAKAADAAILDLLSTAKQKALISTLNRISRKADELAERQARAERKAHRRRMRQEAKLRAQAEGGKKDKRKRKRTATSRRPDRKAKGGPTEEGVSPNAER